MFWRQLLIEASDPRHPLHNRFNWAFGPRPQRIRVLLAKRMCGLMAGATPLEIAEYRGSSR